MPVLSPTILPSRPRPLSGRIAKPQAELTVWTAVKIGIWCVSAVCAGAAVITLTLVGGVVYGILSGIAHMGRQLVSSAVRDMRVLWKWVERP